MLKYFAYGSNCDPAVMTAKGVEFTSRQRALLRGYRLLFNKMSLRRQLPASIGFANIDKDPNGCVEGVLYGIAAERLGRLDESERYPSHYDRIRVVVEADDTQHECWTYQAQPDKTAAGLVPSRNYLNHILAARELLTQQYYETLDQSQTYVAECASCHRERELLFLKEGDRLGALCQPCREAKIIWGDALGRRLTLAETEAVMTQLVMQGQGFSSIAALIQEARARGLIGVE